MKKFTLEVLYAVVGVGSSSGLHFAGNQIFLISDNASILYAYNRDLDVMSRLALYDSSVTENIPKREKPDLESLAFSDGKLHAFGSGSTINRNRLFQIDLKTEKVEMKDLGSLYQRMRTISGIDIYNFNIEGALSFDNKWYLFQRGNGKLAKNGFFKIGDALSPDPSVTFYETELPDINGFSCGFTDAIVIGGDCYFLAAAEDSVSTYDDGTVAGSAIGILDLEAGKVTDFTIISDTHKFEGLTLFRNDALNPSFLLCEDNDSDVLETKIYKLTMAK